MVVRNEHLIRVQTLLSFLINEQKLSMDVVKLNIKIITKTPL